MRLAIHIKTHTKTEAEVELGILDEQITLPVRIYFKKGPSGLRPLGVSLPTVHECVHPDYVLEVASQVLKELAKHDFLTLTPAQLLYRAGKNGARQIAFDAAQKKWVTVKSARDTESVWWAVNAKGDRIHADACVEKAKGAPQAATFMRVRVADIMGEHPKLAGDLAKWFVDGCKVAEEKAGSVIWIDVADFDEAANPAAALAEKTGKTK
jgi:hypothetical protein